VAATLYALVAVGLSVAPLRAAFHQLASASASEGPTRAAALDFGKVAARQAIVVAAPPFLLLWFGWDVWFAFVGFFGPKPEPDDDTP
jgi:hypothetical protein